MRRRVVLLVGVLALAIGFGTLFVPTATIPYPDELVTAVGILALVLALGAVRRRWRHPPDLTEPPRTEASMPVTVPGRELDALVSSLNAAPRRHYRRTELRERITDVAVEILRIYDGVSPADGRAAISDGSWTDDALAAEALATDHNPGGLQVMALLKRQFRIGPTFEDRLRATVDELAARIETRTSHTFEPRRQDSEDRNGHPGDRDPTAVLTDTAVPTRYWTGIEFVVFAGIGMGAIAREPTFLLLAVVGIGYLAYAQATSVQPPRLSVTREIDDRTFEPGETVVVTTHIRNEGDRFIPDLRYVDGVPRAVSVVDGSPRIGTALRPGATGTIRYAIEARRGVHEFTPGTAIVTSVAGSRALTTRVHADDRIECTATHRPIANGLPLRDATTAFSGNVATETPGDGMEFHSVREYRPGDRLARIDWRRLARTGEPATIDYRRERAATIVVLIDTRPGAYVAPSERDTPHAIDRSVAGAQGLIKRLLADGNRVGLASVHPNPCWHPPGAGRDTIAHVEALLASHGSFAPVPGSESFSMYYWMRWFEAKTPANMQVVLFTPMHDDVIMHVVRQLEASRIPVSVISPDPTTGHTTGRRLLAMERHLRLAKLRETGLTVVDWPWDQPLDLAVARLREAR